MSNWILTNIWWLAAIVGSFVLGYAIGGARVMLQVINDDKWEIRK